MQNYLTLLGTRERHYVNMVKMYSNCSVVLENLEVTYSLEHHDLGFLQGIQEVGGYVLIAMNEAAAVPLAGLRLIRGEPCDPRCDTGSCWAAGPDHCQRYNYVVAGGSCVRTCSAGTHEVEERGVQRCKDCDGPCPKGRETRRDLERPGETWRDLERPGETWRERET
ncbi:Melanoma receptor tyrosine-protein kinase [Liparis tanakae]|uniref:Melanoma receptor tyrosine-protein kinase n=1 Tax=Liparis tanakae TaxID=230148 RepID=A0A4Z2ECU6_9TELE|nr:Melanoma receptor tyrosine-protein kinase [Liparis tanakae]